MPTASTAQPTLLSNSFDTLAGGTLTMLLKNNTVIAKGGQRYAEWSPSGVWTSQEFQVLYTNDRLTVIGGTYHLNANA